MTTTSLFLVALLSSPVWTSPLNNTAVQQPHTTTLCAQSTRGADGRDGREGPPGRDGRDGLTGPQGPVGPPGPSQGEKGEQGVPGESGERGQEGHIGPRGLPGLSGAPAEKGEVGPPGQSGIIGPRGSPGITGIPGRIGHPGPPAEKGEFGLPGQPGIPGQPGKDGLHGEKGEFGVPGQSGIRGQPGQPGRDGPRGLHGEKGEFGEPGLPGIPGRDGLHGEKGEVGLPGRRGLRGSGRPGETGPPGPKSGGVVYTRWGSSLCPNVANTSLVYTGRAAGSYYLDPGSGANHLCMPTDPQYISSPTATTTVQGYATLHGVEYRYPMQSSQHDHNVPCAVCLASTRETVLMLPAKTSCPTSWTEEYEGYLMTEHNNHRRSMFECIDRSQQSISGTSANVIGALFYHVEVNCDGLPCPPYSRGKEVTCVVCTY